MRKPHFILICSLALFALQAVAQGDGPSVKAGVNKTAAMIGDRIRYTITVESQDKLDIEYPKFPDRKIGDFEIKDEGSYAAKHVFARPGYAKWYDIAGYSTGRKIIPSVEVKYKRPKEKDWSSLKTKDVGLVIESAIKKGEEVSDIREIKGPRRLRDWMIVAIASLAALILISCAIFLIRKTIERLRPPPRPVYEIVLEGLEDARRSYAESGDVKGCYVKMSDLVRYYIEITFSLKAPEMTTEEFLGSLKGSSTLTPEQKRSLEGFLTACDLVKFARYAPGREEIDAVFMSARNLIEETKGQFMNKKDKRR